MYRTARAQKNGFESAILACKQYYAENNKYPTETKHLISWCKWSKIEGVQHRFANIIIPILRYREYKFIDYTRDQLSQFIYDYVEEQLQKEEEKEINMNHDLLKIQKCIMDFKIDGKTFVKMNEKEWIQRLNDYGIQKEIAQKYYKIIVKIQSLS